MSYSKITVWTADRVKFLRENYGPLSAREIGLALGLTKSAITKQAQKCGLSKPATADSLKAYGRMGGIKRQRALADATGE